MRLSGWMQRLGAFQARRPWLPLLVCLALGVLAVLQARHLELRTRFDQLLPDSQPSVVELRRVQAKTSMATNIYVVFEGEDTMALRAYADAVLQPLRDLGPENVSSASSGVQRARDFLMRRAGLFQTYDELAKLKSDVDARWDWEVAKAEGSLLDEGEPPPPLTAEELKKRFEGKKGRSSETEYPDGYFQSKDGKAVIALVATPVAAGDVGRAQATLDRVKAVVDKAPHAPGIKVSYAGDLVTGLVEYGAALRDLTQVGALGVFLVLMVVFLFFGRVRALLVLGITILTAIAWTFGLTELTIGHLNIATSFLISIIAGNGINTGIVWLQRFYEERRKGVAVDEAIGIAQKETSVPTLVAALASTAAYGSMLLTDFRAFKHFAVIGGAGMVLSWLCTMVLLPCLVVLFDQASPASFPTGNDFLSRMRRGGVEFQWPFVEAVKRAPRALAVSGAVTLVLGVVMAVVYVRSDPMEYDIRKLKNDMGAVSDLYRVVRICDDVLGAKIDSSMVVLVDKVDQVKPLKQILEERRDKAPAGDKPLEAVHTLLDFVPDQQDEKLELLEPLGERMRRAHERGMITDKDWKDIEPLVPPEDLKSFAIGDLPEELARPFTEKDGTRGRLVLVEPAAGKSDTDLRYLLRYADSFRETKLPDGTVVRGSGRAVIFADMLAAVQRDMPRAISAALVLTIIAVVLTFRQGRFAVAVLASFAVGIAGLAVYLQLVHVKINFFNFIALPITFGIGVDYAVNLMQRYFADGEERSILSAMRTTGGAVVLCSLTTVFGYLALVGSMNQAIRSLGVVAVAGELTCLASAMLVLAGAALWREMRKPK